MLKEVVQGICEISIVRSFQDLEKTVTNNPV